MTTKKPTVAELAALVETQAAAINELTERLEKAESASSPRNPLPGNLVVIRDPEVPDTYEEDANGNPIHKNNCYYGYLTIPEGMSGTHRLALWRRKNGNLGGTFLNKDERS